MKNSKIEKIAILKVPVIIIMVLLTLPFTSRSQVNIVAFGGINSTRVKYFDYLKGGNYPLVGLEIEVTRRPRKITQLQISFVSGATFLTNGFYRDSGISVPGLTFTAGTSELKTKYLQVPVLLKLNYRPYPLLEDWFIFSGVGISNDLLLNSTLEERETNVILGSGILTSPPLTTSWSDSKAITEYGRKYAAFLRLELGSRFKRLQFSYRISFSIHDMHHEGIEEVWSVPVNESTYFFPKELNSSRKEKYSEFVVGFLLR